MSWCISCMKHTEDVGEDEVPEDVCVKVLNVTQSGKYQLLSICSECHNKKSTFIKNPDFKVDGKSMMSASDSRETIRNNTLGRKPRRKKAVVEQEYDGELPKKRGRKTGGCATCKMGGCMSCGGKKGAGLGSEDAISEMIRIARAPNE